MLKLKNIFILALIFGSIQGWGGNSLNSSSDILSDKLDFSKYPTHQEAEHDFLRALKGTPQEAKSAIKKLFSQKPEWGENFTPLVAYPGSPYPREIQRLMKKERPLEIEECGGANALEFLGTYLNAYQRFSPETKETQYKSSQDNRAIETTQKTADRFLSELRLILETPFSDFIEEEAQVLKGKASQLQIEEILSKTWLTILEDALQTANIQLIDILQQSIHKGWGGDEVQANKDRLGSLFYTGSTFTLSALNIYRTYQKYSNDFRYVHRFEIFHRLRGIKYELLADRLLNQSKPFLYERLEELYLETLHNNQKLDEQEELEKQEGTRSYLDYRCTELLSNSYFRDFAGDLYPVQRLNKTKNLNEMQDLSWDKYFYDLQNILELIGIEGLEEKVEKIAYDEEVCFNDKIDLVESCKKANVDKSIVIDMCIHMPKSKYLNRRREERKPIDDLWLTRIADIIRSYESTENEYMLQIEQLKQCEKDYIKNNCSKDNPD